MDRKDTSPAGLSVADLPNTLFGGRIVKIAHSPGLGIVVIDQWKQARGERERFCVWREDTNSEIEIVAKYSNLSPVNSFREVSRIIKAYAAFLDTPTEGDPLNEGSLSDMTSVADDPEDTDDDDWDDELDPDGDDPIDSTHPAEYDEDPNDAVWKD